MDLLKHAIATGGNYTEIMQMEQQQAITAQEQSEGMLSSDQNTTMTFPKSSGDFHTQGMKFNLDISKFDNTGNLVKSYENTPPGIQNLSMGTGEGTVIETPSSYQKGGFEKQFNTNYQESQNYQRIKNSRDGVRENKDGSHSTHLMADNNKDEAWPTLFQDENGNWFEGGYEEAKRRGEIYKFDSKKELTDFARKGNWKNAYQNGGFDDKDDIKEYEVPKDLEGKLNTGADGTLNVNPRVYRALHDITNVVKPDDVKEWTNSMSYTSRYLIPYEWQTDFSRKRANRKGETKSASELLTEMQADAEYSTTTKSIKDRGIRSVIEGSDKLTDKEFENFKNELKKIAKGFQNVKSIGKAMTSFYNADLSGIKEYREKMGLSREDILALIQPSETANIFEKGKIGAIKSGLKLKKWQKGGFNKYQKTGFLEKLTNPIRKQLAEHLYPVGYDGSRINEENEVERYGPLGKIYNALRGREDTSILRDRLENTMPPDKYKALIQEREDFLQLVMGQDQKHNTVNASKYRPSDSKDKNAVYYTSQVTEDLLKEFLSSEDGELNTVIDDKNPIKRSKPGSGIDSKDQDIPWMVKTRKDFTGKKVVNAEGTLGNFTIDRGTDEDGREYVSYYDKWDLDPFKVDNKSVNAIMDKVQSAVGVNSPEVYGRIYLDELKYGGFTKYQSKGFTIIRKEGDEHVRDVDISSVNFDLLYNAIEQHEHRGVIDEKDYDSFIRTNATGSGSSAYGPIQLTRDKLLDLTTPGKRAYYDVENVDPTFHSAIIQQGDAMLEFGGSDMPEGGITEDGEDVSMFDYGQVGVIGNTTRDREKYKRMGIQILEGDYRFAVKNPKKDVNTLHQMLKAYGTGTNKYAKDVLKIYNELLEEESNTFKLENILKSKTK